MKYKTVLTMTSVLLIGILIGAIVEWRWSTRNSAYKALLEHKEDDHSHGTGKSSQVTVWSDRFEIFLEHPLVVAGIPSKFVTHVSDMVTLEPRKKGPVAFILRHGSEVPIKHVERAPVRDGIYIPELTFSRPGQWRISLAIPLEGEEHLVELPTIKVYGSQTEVDRAPLPEEVPGISFLKEQQWEIPTKTEAARRRKVLDLETLAIPESALVDEGGKPTAFVQVAGETFEKRYLKLGGRDSGFVQVLSGLSEGEYITTKGAYAVAQAEHGEVSIVHLSDTQIKKFGIEVGAAGPGQIEIHVTLPGEIVINTDCMAHLVPRVPGVVREVKKKLGSPVKQGEILAVIDSRDLADAKATYLAAIERFDLAKATFEREEKLRKQEISSEQEYLNAKQSLVEAQIGLRSSKQKLMAMGFSNEYLQNLTSEPDSLLTRFEIVAPFDGTITRKHIALGEAVKNDTEVFVLADLDTVWVDLRVHQKDLPLIEKGQKVRVCAASGISEIEGTIDYVAPVIEEKTRTALARVVLPNISGKYRPGLFVTGIVTVDCADANIVVEKSCIQYIEDQPCVFVHDGRGFERRNVALGQSNENCVEVTSGLKPGEKIVTENSFRIKSELDKHRTAGTAHGHIH